MIIGSGSGGVLRMRDGSRCISWQISIRLEAVIDTSVRASYLTDMSDNWQSSGRASAAGPRLEVLSAHALRLWVRDSGHRIGAEPFVLVSTLPQRTYNRAADLGCGSGIIPLLLGKSGRAAEIWGIELEEEDAVLAERNVAGNAMTGKITIRRGHVRKAAAALTRGSFDLLTCNPPFFPFDAENGEHSPATHEVAGTLKEFLASAAQLAKKDALLAIVYHPSRLLELLATLPVFRFGPARLIGVHPARGKPASFAIVHAIANALPRFDIRPPVFLDEEL